MSKPISISGKVALEYLKKFPNLPTRTLATKIYNENKELFKTYDNIREIIKYYRGKSGEKSRSKLGNKSFVDVKVKSHIMPESHTKHVDVWKLPKANKKVLILSDIHIPYHDVEAIKVALNEGKQQGIDTIYLNGDILDFFMLSFHEKNPKNRPSLKNEIDMAREFFAYLRQEFPNVTIYFKPGNHEYRLERYLYIKAPELLDCEEFKLDILLGLAEFQIIYIHKRTKTYFGHLLIEHGDRMRGNGGVNPARSLYMRYKRHVLAGHFHRKSEHVEKIYDGSLVTSFSTGCLCELEPEYFEVNNHSHGMSIVEMDGDNFKVKNYLIENATLY